MRVLLTVLAATVAAAAPASAQADATAKLRVVSAKPLVVAGTGYAARERVVVSALTSLGLRVTRVRASATGTFRAGFAAFAQPCGKPFAVRARGLASRRVALARVPAAPCVPPPIH